MWNSLEMNFSKMMAATNNSKAIDVDDRIKYRYEASTINDRCVAGALKLVKASGGSTVYLEHDVTNRFIDIMMTQVHVANISDPYSSDYGSSILGIETQNLML
jgi:3-hydroxy-9,10-secoandrosta-1,3,5(10)-triene-9,17-dione monooxygenase